MKCKAKIATNHLMRDYDDIQVRICHFCRVATFGVRMDYRTRSPHNSAKSSPDMLHDTLFLCTEDVDASRKRKASSILWLKSSASTKRCWVQKPQSFMERATFTTPNAQAAKAVLPTSMYTPPPLTVRVDQMSLWCL
eukprot:3370336-Amphidinium_carterae.1